MIKLVAFDWNGTLIADAKAAAEATNDSLRFFGHKPVSKYKYRQAFDIPILKFWLEIGGKKSELQKQHEIFHPRYEQLAKNVRTRRGTKQILHWLRTRKIDVVIYSNHTKDEIFQQLERLGIKRYFSEVLSRPHKEDTSILLNRGKSEKLHDYVKKNKYQTSQVVTVGDTREEIEIGHHLGFITVAITGGHNTTPQLKKHKPDFLIGNLNELKKVIRKINNKYVALGHG